MDEQVDAAVVQLAQWASAASADAAVDSRRREQLVRRQAEDEATIASVLAGLVERRASVTIRTQLGGAHRGVLVGLGTDYAALVSDRRLTLVRLAAIDAVRPEEPAQPAAFAEGAATTSRLVTVLTGIADDGADVNVVTASGAMTGELLAVGEDVLTLRPSGAQRGEVLYVPVASVSEASLRLSG